MVNSVQWMVNLIRWFDGEFNMITEWWNWLNGKFDTKNEWWTLYDDWMVNMIKWMNGHFDTNLIWWMNWEFCY